MNEKITVLVLAALRDLGEELSLPDLANASGGTRLFGAKSSLDSMGLVSLIADLEGRIEAEFGRNVILADERAMSQVRSPFRTVDSLTAHIEGLLNEPVVP
jgi:acyl carrier protein